MIARAAAGCKPILAGVCYDRRAIQVASRPRKGTIPACDFESDTDFFQPMSGRRAIQEDVVSQLPPRPSLSHLRKQAKDLLRRLRQRSPDATLAEAQYALAREYGFDSWPKLKSQVELLAALPQPVTFQRYTLKAREAVFYSRYEASQLGSRTIEPEHVLLGLIRASQGLKGRMFDQANVSLDRARLELCANRSSEPLPLAERVSTGERAQGIFRAAVEEADALKHHDIGLAHILIGVLRVSDSVATTLLDRMGVRLQSVRDRISLLLNEEPM